MQGKALVGGPGGEASGLKFTFYGTYMRQKPHPVYPCTKYKVRRKTQQVQEPMKKGKFAQHVFVTLVKLKLQMKLQISLHAQGPIPNKIDQNFFLEHLMYTNTLIPSLTIPPRATPRDSHVLIARAVGFSSNFLCPGARGFELEKFSAVLTKSTARNFAISFKETRCGLKSRCSCSVYFNFFKSSRCLLLL